MSTMKTLIPACLGPSLLVRASRKQKSANMARLVQIFCPETMKFSPSGTARVRRLARSEPALGSENPWHHSSSEARRGGRYRRLCSSVPWAMIARPM